MIYLDNGATTFPKPLSVRRTIIDSFNNYSANPGRSGHKMSLVAAKKIYDCRKTIKDFFNVKSEEEVIFTQNCTMALNTVIFGILKPGDHVIISSMEHNSVLRPVESLKKAGVTYSLFDYSYDDDITVDNVRKLLLPETKLVICTHASNVFGFRFPIERISALCHYYDILFCVDAAQSAGVFPIDVIDNGYDFVCMSGHKSLYGPMGTGILLLNNHNLKPLLYGGTGTESENKNQPDILPEKFESGTQNLNGIVGLMSGINFIKNIGTKEIYKKEFTLTKYLYNELKNCKNSILYTKEPQYGKTAPVLSFNIKGKHSEETVKILNDNGICARGGLHCAPLAHQHMNTIDTGTVRIVPSVFSSKAEIEKVIYTIRKIKN